MVSRMDSAARSCVPRFVYVLEALSFGTANIRDSGLVVFHNCIMPFDSFTVDLRSAATMNNIIASGVLFHNCTSMPHDRIRVDPNMIAKTVMTTGTQM